MTLVHAAAWSGMYAFPWAANVAVDGFFLLSGYVLARNYSGTWALFMAGRAIRLWPLYAVCLTAGYALHGLTPQWRELLWLPSPRLLTLGLTDKPVWTLYVEAWASPGLPVLVWLARRNRMMGVLAAGLAMAAASWIGGLTALYLALFCCGIAASQYHVAWPERSPAWCLWLGRRAYSLYLGNWMVFEIAARGGPWVVWGALPVALAVAWGLERWVERPSVRWSRRVGRPAIAIPVAVQAA